MTGNQTASPARLQQGPQQLLAIGKFDSKSHQTWQHESHRSMSAPTLSEPRPLVTGFARDQPALRAARSRPVAVIGPKLPPQGFCPSDCRCTCHGGGWSRRSSAPVLGASSVGGSLNTKKCSLSRCLASRRRSSRQPKFTLPPPILRVLRTMAVLLPNPRQGNQLKTLLIVPEFSDIVRATNHGDVEILQRIFESKKGSPDNMSPDGWSLLHVSRYAAAPYQSQ